MSIVPSNSSGASQTISHLPLTSFIHFDRAMALPSATLDNQRWNRLITGAFNGVREDETRDSQGASLTANPPSRSKSGLRHVCPELDGVRGAPPLPVLITKDPRTIERWMEENVYCGDNDYATLGFDLESISKPPWKPHRASLPDGPATVQLSTPASCIIIQLSRCGDGSAKYAPIILREIINNPKIIKVGVSIDDDALELYRWSKSSAFDARRNINGYHPQQASQLWEMASRFDIGCILPNKNPSRRSGIRELAQTILGVEITKSKVGLNPCVQMNCRALYCMYYFFTCISNSFLFTARNYL